MRALGSMVAVGILLGSLLGDLASAAEPDPAGLARLLADRLAARRSLARTHTTDFAGEDLGCITLPRRELRPHGYPGHAFLCEAEASGEVLGAVLNSKGFRLCFIAGAYTGDSCYDFDICGHPERLCVQ